MTNKQKGEFRVTQIIPFIYFIIYGSFSGTICSLILKTNKEDSFIISLICCLIGIIPILLFLHISSKYPNKNIFEIIEYSFGKIIGKFINIFLIVFAIIYLCISFNNLISFVSNEYLYKTPSIFITILFLIPTIILISKKLKVILRCGTIIFIFSLLLFLISISSLIFESDITNIFPIFKNTSLNSSLIIFSYLIFPLFFLLCIPKNRFENNKTFNKTFIISYLIIMFLLTVFIFCIISTLGIDLSLFYKYPDFQVLRKVRIGSFLSRVESTLAIGWILNSFMLNIFMCYFIKTGFSYFNIKNKYIFNIIVIVILLMKINFLTNSFLINTYSKLSFVFLFLIPVLILILSSKKSHQIVEP